MASTVPAILNQGWGEGREFLEGGAEQAARAVVEERSTAWAQQLQQGGGPLAPGTTPGRPVDFKTASEALRAVALEAVRPLVCALPRTGVDLIVTRGAEEEEEGWDGSCAGGGCSTASVQRHQLIYELR